MKINEAQVFASKTWGQEVVVQGAVNGMVPIIVSDFDAGQCTKIAVESGVTLALAECLKQEGLAAKQQEKEEKKLVKEEESK